MENIFIDEFLQLNTIILLYNLSRRNSIYLNKNIISLMSCYNNNWLIINQC